MRDHFRRHRVVVNAPAIAHHTCAVHNDRFRRIGSAKAVCQHVALIFDGREGQTPYFHMPDHILTALLAVRIDGEYLNPFAGIVRRNRLHTWGIDVGDRALARYEQKDACLVGAYILKAVCLAFNVGKSEPAETGRQRLAEAERTGTYQSEPPGH